MFRFVRRTPSHPKVFDLIVQNKEKLQILTFKKQGDVSYFIIFPFLSVLFQSSKALLIHYPAYAHMWRWFWHQRAGIASQPFHRHCARCLLSAVCVCVCLIVISVSRASRQCNRSRCPHGEQLNAQQPSRDNRMNFFLFFFLIMELKGLAYGEHTRRSFSLLSRCSF